MNGNVDNLTIPLAPPSTLTGKVIIRDGSVNTERLSITLWERGRSFSDKSVPFDPKTGAFRFADLPAGYYKVSVIDPGRESYLDIRAEGGEFDPEGCVRITGGSPVALELTYRPGSVER